MGTKPPARAKAPNRVKELRLARGLTQAELGAIVGVAHTQIGRIENGERGTPWRRMKAIADALRADPFEVFSDYPRGGRAPDDEEVLNLVAQMDDATRAHWLEVGRGLLNLGSRTKPRRTATR